MSGVIKINESLLVSTNNINNDMYDYAYENNIPINSDLHITYNCNLKCKHCYAEDRKDNEYSSDILNTIEIKSIIDGLVERIL